MSELVSFLAGLPPSTVIPGGFLAESLDWSSDPSLRRRGLGASESAAALGLDDYKGRLKLWREKLGLDDPDDIEHLASIRHGRLLEPYLLDNAELLGCPPVVERQVLVSCECRPYLHATLDGVTASGEPVEAKSINPMARGAMALAEASEHGTPDVALVPERWRLQVTQQMLCTGAERAWLLVAVLGRKEFCVPIAFDGAIAETMLPGLDAFWAHVESGTPPPATGPDIETLRALKPEEGKIIHLPEVCLRDADELARAEFDIADCETGIAILARDLKARKDEAERRATAAKARLYQMLEDAAIGILPDGRRVEAPIRKRKSYTVSASEKRSLAVRGRAQ